MKATFPLTRSMTRTITPKYSAEIMFLLGDSARFKIIRAVQLHYNPPPISPDTDKYTPFFQFLSEGVEDHWTVQQQYSSCKWAAPKNEPLATAMLLYYGWAPRYKQYKMGGNCIYQMRRAADGIHLVISNPHTYNDRLYAACSRAAMIASVFNEKKHKAPCELLFKEACRVFFTFDGYYVSITASYRQAVLNKIQSYCLHLNNALDSALPIVPIIEDPAPEDCIPILYDVYDQPTEYVMKWEDFEFDDNISAVQQEHLENIGRAKTQDALLEKWGALGLGDAEYTDAQLREHFAPRLLKSARDKEYLIQGRKEGRKTFWKLNYERS